MKLAPRASAVTQAAYASASSRTTVMQPSRRSSTHHDGTDRRTNSLSICRQPHKYTLFLVPSENASQTWASKSTAPYVATRRPLATFHFSTEPSASLTRAWMRSLSMRDATAAGRPAVSASAQVAVLKMVAYLGSMQRGRWHGAQTRRCRRRDGPDLSLPQARWAAVSMEEGGR